ncbi:MAG: hypothetical protein HYZ42_07935, partial [Bacteroidetes bacterium]|nr:hypothetical protein [Bacteroidota bacterium]
NNMIGSNAQSGSINIKGAVTFGGINSTYVGNVYASNNQVSGITLAPSGSTSFTGFSFSSATGGMINSNTVGSTSLTNSINGGGTGTWTGILSSTTSTSSAPTIRSNMFSNVTRTQSASGITTIGISSTTSSVTSPYYIDSNTVQNFSSTGVETFTGISCAGATAVTIPISYNTIKDLSFTSTASTGSFNGIVTSGTGFAPQINSNIIGSNTVNGSISINYQASFNGISSSATGNNQIYDNLISGIAQTSTSNGSTNNGISISSATGGNCYNNTVGSSTLSNANSYAGSSILNCISQSTTSATSACAINNNLIANITRTSSGSVSTNGIKILLHL